jgi:hypothetical protein
MRPVDWSVVALLCLVLARLEHTPWVSGALLVSAIACGVAALTLAARDRTHDAD